MNSEEEHSVRGYWFKWIEELEVIQRRKENRGGRGRNRLGKGGRHSELRNSWPKMLFIIANQRGIFFCAYLSIYLFHFEHLISICINLSTAI